MISNKGKKNFFIIGFRKCKCPPSLIISHTIFYLCLMFWLYIDDLIFFTVPSRHSAHLFSGWFGIRKDFCQFLLGICPCLQEYGNISYSTPSSTETVISDAGSDSTKREKTKKKPLDDQHKVVMPIISIDMPDWK